MQGKQHEHQQQRQPLQAIHGALLAAAIAAGMGLAMPQDLMPSAQAETVAERRKAEAQQRKELLSKAYVLSMQYPVQPLMLAACACICAARLLGSLLQHLLQRHAWERWHRREDALKKSGTDFSGGSPDQAPPPGPSTVDAKVQPAHVLGQGAPLATSA